MKNKYNWKEVQSFYNDGHTILETAEKFGMTKQNLSKSRFFTARPKEEQKAMSVSTRIKNGNNRHSQETKEKLSKIAIDRKFGGRNYRKTFYYKGYVLESTYELKLAQELDSVNVTWERPKYFYWIDKNNKKRRYTPDFYLPEFDVYLDPKNNYLIETDTEKIKICSEQNNVKILVLNKHQLHWEYIKELLRV